MGKESGWNVLPKHGAGEDVSKASNHIPAACYTHSPLLFGKARERGWGDNVVENVKHLKGCLVL